MNNLDLESVLISVEDFFSSETLWLFVYFAVGYCLLLWLALVVWVARDSVGRSNSLVFQIFSILISLCLPVFGLVVYLIIRPNKTLVERYYEEMEFRALSEGISGTLTICPKCGESVGSDFVVCPSCAVVLRKECKKCKRVFDVGYSLCPYCGTPTKKELETKVKPKKKK